MRKNLILITSIYPYGYGESFLETELFYLSKSFEKIIILPFRKSTHIRYLPENVKVSNILTKEKKIGIFLKYFAESIFSKDLRRALTCLTYKQRILCVVNLILFKCKSSYIKKSIERYMRLNNLKYCETIFYTYWLTSGAYGLGLLKKQESEIKLVSRAHGFDIYFERWLYNFIPFHLENIKNLDKLYLISKDGYQYLSKKYAKKEPNILDKMKISRLGVKKSYSVKEESKPKSIFRILTCSNFFRVKRLDLLIDALVIIGNTNLNKKIEWTHIGGKKPLGKSGQENYQEMAIRKLRPNIELNFQGVLVHDDVLKMYQNKWFDVFINVSDSEGIPVSIMEALSSGIPVIARNVGGIAEIVNNENGLLLNSNLLPEQLAETLLTVITSDDELLLKRQAAIDSWEIKYDADSNYKQFATDLSYV